MQLRYIITTGLDAHESEIASCALECAFSVVGAMAQLASQVDGEFERELSGRRPLSLGAALMISFGGSALRPLHPSALLETVKALIGMAPLPLIGAHLTASYLALTEEACGSEDGIPNWIARASRVAMRGNPSVPRLAAVQGLLRELAASETSLRTFLARALGAATVRMVVAHEPIGGREELEAREREWLAASAQARSKLAQSRIDGVSQRRAKIGNAARMSSQSRAGFEAAVCTDGVCHEHAIYDLSEIDDECLVALPLYLKLKERVLTSSTTSVSTHLFASFDEAGRPALRATYRARSAIGDWPQSGGSHRPDLQSLLRKPIGALEGLAELSNGLSVSMSQHSAAIAIAEASCQPYRPTFAVRSWGGMKQIDNLRKFGASAMNERELARLRRLDAHFVASMPLYACIDGRRTHGDVASDCRRQLASLGWSGGPLPHSSRAYQPSLNPPHLPYGSSAASIVARRIALPPENPGYMAAFYMAAAELEASWVGPSLRDHVGAYGASVGLDVALSEVIVAIYRTSNARLALSEIGNAKPIRAGWTKRAGGARELRQRALARMCSHDVGLNALVRGIFAMALSVETKMAALKESIVSLPLDRAEALIGTIFSELDSRVVCLPAECLSLAIELAPTTPAESPSSRARTSC